MTRSLSELICNDLSYLAYEGSETVASDEAIRCMVAVYLNQGKLHNIHILHKDEFQSFLKNILSVNTLKNSKEHYQCLIEVGFRSHANQRDPASIHYCAVDLYLEPGKKPLAFAVDHLRGHDIYYNNGLNKIAEELDIHFVMPGGGIFQADSVHCPVFSIHHLLQTAHDTAIPVLLNHVAKDTTQSTHTYFHWNELPPQCIYPSQSISMLFHYIDHIKNKEDAAKEEPSAVLKNSPFVDALPASIYSDPKLGHKVRNKSIKALAARLSGHAVSALENNADFDEKALIDICYQDKYPRVHPVLRKALDISIKCPLGDKGTFKAHPLFELVFSFASPMEICFSNQNFRDIFSEKAVLTLMHKGLIDARGLFNKMTFIQKDVCVRKDACNVLKSNLQAIKIIESCLEKHPEANPGNISALIESKNCRLFFNNVCLSTLFQKGLLNIGHVDKILTYKIDNNKLSALGSDAERLNYLNETFSLGLPSAMEEADAPEDVIPPQKPSLNAGLLASSMSQSIFSAKYEPREKDFCTPGSKVMTLS